jgi:hypothetical protein
MQPLSQQILAQMTDRGMVLATALLDMLRQQHIIVPTIDVIERVCAEALTRGIQHVYEALTESLSADQRQMLDNLLSVREGTMTSSLTWLRQPPGVPNAKHVLAHIERLRTIGDLGLSDGLERSIILIAPFELITRCQGRRYFLLIACKIRTTCLAPLGLPA